MRAAAEVDDVERKLRLAAPSPLTEAEPSATAPPEARGLARDQVRLLVAQPSGIHHLLFRDIARFLRAGDLLVVNTSATLASATDGTRRDGRRVVVHFSSAVSDGTWVVELRSPDGSGPARDGERGERLVLSGGARLTLMDAYPDPALAAGGRLWRAQIDLDGSVADYLARWGRPITYGYLAGAWPLESYQTVFACHPGSAEMPSAARPFTDRLVTQLVSNGVLFAPVLLHAGVSSLEAGEAPPPERFKVTETTARLVNHVRNEGGRVIAIGTTSTRALETVASRDGTVAPGEGWTEVVLSPDRPALVVDGLVTGWHSSDAPHRGLLEAVAGSRLVHEAYAAAREARYLWHEFGDSALFLPDRVA